MALTITEVQALPALGDNREWIEVQAVGEGFSTTTLQISSRGRVTDTFTLTLAEGEYAVLHNANGNANSIPDAPDGVQVIAISGWIGLNPNGGFSIALVDTSNNEVAVANVPIRPNDATPQDSYDAVADEFTTPTPGEPCFVTGTHVLTEAGEVKVEDLQVGDRVKTVDGKSEVIKWIGRRTVDPKGPRHPFRSLPIQIKAGALGNHLPTRDLYVSPDHAVLVDGLLVNAGALENNISIVITNPEETFSYFHIELEKHSLLLTEGTPTESFLPQMESRETFDNGDDYDQLYPNHNIFSLLPMNLPRVSSQRQLPRFVKQRLMQVAETLPGVEALATVQ